MAMLGMSQEEMRLPMTNLEESKRADLAKVLRDYGMLK
jgi:dihydrodipicolinate synthase/N-acetylneuraminate lyase